MARRRDGSRERGITTADIELEFQAAETGSDSSKEMVINLPDGLETQNGPAILAVDGNLIRHLLLPASSEDLLDEDLKSGVQISSRRLPEHSGEQWYVDVYCMKRHLNELFSILIVEMLEEVRKSRRPIFNVCRGVLDRWRELLRIERKKAIDTPRLIGLMGELFILRMLAERNSTAIDYWKGPEGDRHDFQCVSSAIEVKTSTQDWLHPEIHGAEQLALPDEGELFLAVLRLEPNTEQAESLPDVFESISALGGDTAQMIDKLYLAGVSPDQFKALRERPYELSDMRLFRVDGSFPKVTEDQFISGELDDRVKDLVYRIDLSGGSPTYLSEAEEREVLNITSGVGDYR